ncbi:MAG: Endonuclease III [candidate division WS2 bacterium]|uniref:Endonuclease III n=1 Tax=Psychracetigena formicireducens TaxID=2986056 RepID=A0A9E2BIE5_PSYF1|nr:Endonuclease III [Candidatus Psychracetigena formicireducens]
MRRAERYKFLMDWFKVNQPEVETELQYTNPYELLVAVALSAQCTDKRVNMVTPHFFQRFPNPESLKEGTFEEVFAIIRSISYPNNKAKHLLGMGKILMEEFGGEVPSTLEELVKIPGVGRKTANVILSVIHNAPTMAVDTHVYRVSRRIGLVNSCDTTPLAVEKTLMKYLPKLLVPKAHHWLILHGRYVCLARSPKCEICAFTTVCNHYLRLEKLKKRLESELLEEKQKKLS